VSTSLDQRREHRVVHRCELQQTRVQALQLAFRHRVEVDATNALLGTRAPQPTKENLGRTGIGNGALPQATLDLRVRRGSLLRRLTIVCVRHAILGAGGVGGLVGGALARAGRDVVLLLRVETLARHPARLRVESVALGEFEVDVATASLLDRDVDVLWVAPKAAQLDSALELAPTDRVGDAVVVPLLNGVDHVAVLRARYDDVLAAVIYVESERLEPGLVRQPTPFARVVVGPGSRQEEITDELRSAGFDVALASDELTLLWQKLALLAPLALTTTARGAPVGVVQADPDWNARLVGCHDEAAAVAIAEGAKLDPHKLRRALLEFSGGEMHTSMQKDFDAHRPLELDAIAGPIVRGRQRHRIATPATEELVRLIEARQVRFCRVTRA
jgi:2-dehydropantoate 2-reductase